MATDNLQNINEKLNRLRVNLRKLGPNKRNKYPDRVKNIFLEAKELYELYKNIIRISESKNIFPSEYTEYVIDILLNEIEDNYKVIHKYYIECSSENIFKMESFDLKTAASLLPVMDSTEETTQKIIDSLELYSSCLKDEGSKKLLISFVLKTRLSKSAKIKLKSQYTSCESLIKDMKSYLLTKKSSSSLHAQLNSISQQEMSISQYASKIEELFVDLTISQADSDDKAYEILRPLNEQIAVKRFADGLRNRRLSTIIAARNYKELKDAVRAAQDEELSQPLPSNSNSMLTYSRGTSNFYYSSRGRSRYVPRSYGYSFNNRYSRGNNHRYNNRMFPNTDVNRGRQINVSRSSNVRNMRTRGKGHRSIHYAEQEDFSSTPLDSTPGHSKDNNNMDSSNNQFFRT